MDISEKGLETLIVKYLTDNNGYEQLTTSAYNKEMALVEEWLVTFIKKTQHKKVTDSMCFASLSEKQKFITRLRDEITKRGVTDVLRKGYKFNGQTFDLYYPLPSKLNKSAKLAYEKNVFGVIRQLRYSKKNENAIDFVVFINGLPLATFELKIAFTDGMMMVVASMLEEKTEFVQHYFNNKDFQNLVNERVFSTIKAQHIAQAGQS